MSLNFLKKQFKLDQRKWEKKVAAQRANGKKGGRPKSSVGVDSEEEKPNQSHGYFKNPTKPKKAEKEKIISTTKKIIINTDRIFKSFLIKEITIYLSKINKLIIN